MRNFIHVNAHAFVRERIFESSREFHSMTQGDNDIVTFNGKTQRAKENGGALFGLATAPLRVTDGNVDRGNTVAHCHFVGERNQGTRALESTLMGRTFTDQAGQFRGSSSIKLRQSSRVRLRDSQAWERVPTFLRSQKAQLRTPFLDNMVAGCARRFRNGFYRFP